ncbi:MAG: PH domain-containing protein [Gemmatimonadaceae bacterium]|nr:PH domain-containing protein [Gemmatimonadaceae bacterium]
MTTTLDQPRVYHISIWRYLVLWWVLGPFLVLGIAFTFSADQGLKLGGIVVALIMSLLLLGWHWLAGRSRLEVSSRGVRLRELGGKLEVAWPEIIDMRTDRGHEGFITAQAMDNVGARRLAATAGPMQMHDASDLQLIGEHRFVPIKAFAVHLHRGDLRNNIAQCAPHLNTALAALDTPPTTRVPTSPAIRRRNWQIAGIIAAAAAFTPVLIVAGERSQLWFFTVANAAMSPFITLGAGYSAWRMLKGKQYLLGVLVALLALVMAGRTAVAWTQLHQLAQHTP